jgi:hypothetical protein
MPSALAVISTESVAMKVAAPIRGADAETAARRMRRGSAVLVKRSAFRKVMTWYREVFPYRRRRHMPPR